MRSREVILNNNKADTVPTRDPFAMEQELTAPVERKTEAPTNPLSNWGRDLAPEPEVVPTPPPEVSQVNTLDTETLDGRASVAPGPEWVRQDLASLFVPYDFNDMFVRIIPWPALSLMSLATRTKNFTLVVDAIDQCISQDARDLTPGDFNLLMYWIRDNSLPKTPITIQWLSRYNNENEESIRGSKLEIQEIELTRAEYATYREFGLVFPTVRDMEIIRSNSVSPQSAWQLDYAQYVALDISDGDYTNYVGRKLEALEALSRRHGMEDVILKINEFSARIQHGVRETVRVRDRKFDPEQAIAYFEAVAANAESVVAGLGRVEENVSEARVIRTLERATAYRREAAVLRERLERGETILADEEVVAIRIEATDFFPGV